MAKRDGPSAVLKGEIARLARVDRLYGQILDLIRETIYVTDKNGTIIVYNKESERMEGLCKDDLLGKKEEEVYPLTDGMSFYGAVTSKVMRTGEPIRNQYYRYLLPNGRLTNFIFSSYPFFEDGVVAAVITIGRNMNQISDFISTTFELQQQILQEEDPMRQGRKDIFLDDIITASPSLLSGIDMAKKVAFNQAPVMISGETGTGKELFARGIHNAGLCRSAPFLPINCGAIPENLLESALFGTVKGAFTGAMDMPGLFEQAGEGTIFLDEINSLPIYLQPKLLRVLQDRMVRRVGSKFEIEVKCRFISASNLDPFDAVQQGIIRSDLFFRLSTFILNLPPLRERPKDIAPLLSHFIQRFNRIYNKDVRGYSEFFLRFLHHYDWPGNVRELENLVESILCLMDVDEKILSIHHIPDYIRSRMEERVSHTDGLSVHRVPSEPAPALDAVPDPAPSYVEMREKVENEERQRIEGALLRNQFNLTKAGAELGISRQTLIYRMKKYGMWKRR